MTGTLSPARGTRSGRRRRTENVETGAGAANEAGGEAAPDEVGAAEDTTAAGALENPMVKKMFLRMTVLATDLAIKRLRVFDV